MTDWIVPSWFLKGEPIDADVVYRYRLIDSIVDGNAKNLRVHRFAPDVAHERVAFRQEGKPTTESLAKHAGALELVKVVKGTLTLEVADEAVQVKAGHSAWFDASYAHAYRNATTKPVAFTLVVFDSV